MAANETIAKVLKTLSDAYPRFILENDDRRRDQVRTWAAYLSDMPDDLLLAAVARFISSSDHAFAPSISEIRAQATELVKEINNIPSAFEAWREVLDAPMPRPAGAAYRKFRDGKYVDDEPYHWPHDIVGRVAERLGWPNHFPIVGNEMADRAHFVKAYDAEVARLVQSQTQVPQVTTYVEKERGRMLTAGDQMTRLAGRLSGG